MCVCVCVCVCAQQDTGIACVCAVAALDRQARSSEARAVAAEEGQAALRQDVINWHARYRKKDAELALQTTKVGAVGAHTCQHHQQQEL